MKKSTHLKKSDFAKILAFDAPRRSSRRTAKYLYLLPLADGGVKIFCVAVRRNENGEPETKIVATHDPRRTRIYCRDLCFHAIAGWQVSWSPLDEFSVQWKFRCGLGFPCAECVNPEALAQTKYARCAWIEKFALIDHLHLYEQDSRVEYVAKAKLHSLLTPHGIKRLAESRDFFDFVRNHLDEIRTNFYGVRDILRAIRYKKTLAESAEYFAAHQNFRCFGGLPDPLKPRALECSRYCDRAKIHVSEYVRYLRHAEELGWTLDDDRTAFPPPKRFRDLLERAEGEAAKIRERARERDRRKRERIFRSGMKNALDRFSPLDGFVAENDDSLRAVLPRSRSDFRREGTAMKNCVGRLGYDEKMAEGSSVVIFIRRDGKPAADLEIRITDNDKPQIVQLYAERNTQPPREVRTFAARLLRLARKCLAPAA